MASGGKKLPFSQSFQRNPFNLFSSELRKSAISIHWTIPHHHRHSPAEESIILLEALAPTLARILCTRPLLLLARLPAVTGQAVALETGGRQLARPEQTRIKVTNGQATKSARVMAATLALLHLGRLDAFAAELTGIRLAGLDPNVFGGQLGTVTLVLVHLDSHIEEELPLC